MSTNPSGREACHKSDARIRTVRVAVFYKKLWLEFEPLGQVESGTELTEIIEVFSRLQPSESIARFGLDGLPMKAPTQTRTSGIQFHQTLDP